MPSSKAGTLGEARYMYEASLKDPKKALELADRYAAESEIEKAQKERDKGHSFDSLPRKKPSKVKLPVLPDAPDNKTSDEIRAIVALRFQQFTDYTIESKLKLKHGRIHAMERQYYGAFETAQAEHAKAILAEYYRNMLVNKAALSRAGAIAVNALSEVASDTAAGSRNRVDAARAILSLVDVKATDRADAPAAVASAMRDTVKMILDKETNSTDTYVIDIEPEEDDGS